MDRGSRRARAGPLKGSRSPLKKKRIAPYARRSCASACGSRSFPSTRRRPDRLRNAAGEISRESALSHQFVHLLEGALPLSYTVDVNLGPRYLELFESGELSRRVERAVSMLRSCRVCPPKLRRRPARGRARGMSHRPLRQSREPLPSLRRRRLSAGIPGLGNDLLRLLQSQMRLLSELGHQPAPRRQRGPG